MPLVSRLAMASIALAAYVFGASGQSFVDSTGAELTKAAPELSTLELDHDQSKLDPLLREAGQGLENMLVKFINVSIGEDVHEMRYDGRQMMWVDHRDQFRYLVRTSPFTELRKQAQGEETPQPDAKSGFLISGRFMDMLGDLLPESQSQ